MLNVSALPSASPAVGWNLYADAATTVVTGVPLTLGAKLRRLAASADVANVVSATKAVTAATWRRVKA